MESYEYMLTESCDYMNMDAIIRNSFFDHPSLAIRTHMQNRQNQKAPSLHA